MLYERRNGALAILETVSSRDEVARALRRLDPNLFAERQITVSGERVWAVVEQTPAGAVTVLQWRDPLTGEPIEYLTMGIVDRIAQRQNTRDMVALTRAVDRENDRLRASRVADAEYAREESAREFKRMVGRVSAVPRSPQLRRSRDKQRARGEKV